MAAIVEGKNKDGMNCRALRELADTTFGKKSRINVLHQEIAENFLPQRADFTFKRHLAEEYAGDLMTSYPLLCQRDLQDQIGTMLRNTNKPWFNMVAADTQRMDHEAKIWLEWATGVQRRAMYSRKSQFARATSLGDGDFSAFGQNVIQVRLNRDGDELLFRCYHLRDMAWLEDEDGQICAYFRRWKPSFRDLMRLFDRPAMGKSVHAEVKRKAGKTPMEECNCYHFMVKADMYDGPSNGKPWVSIYYDCDHQHEMEVVAQRRKEYNVARWLMADGTQYACSPATVAALPEARLLQAMTYTLLEAGEKVVNPPVVATEQVVRSDVSLYAGGITWIDRDYDARTGKPLEALIQDARGMPLSLDMQKDSRLLLMHCFYLNKLSLPQRGPEMTAYEVGQRIQQYIRDALPLFQPMEPEYNGGLCEETFECMMDAGAFGSPFDFPKSLRGKDVSFQFRSPLHDQIDAMKGQKFLEAGQLLTQAISMDRNAAALLDVPTALRDAIEGIGTPTRWTRSKVVVDEMVRKAAEQEQQQALLGAMTQAAPAVKDLASAQQMAQAA